MAKQLLSKAKSFFLSEGQQCDLYVSLHKNHIQFVIRLREMKKVISAKLFNVKI